MCSSVGIMGVLRPLGTEKVRLLFGIIIIILRVKVLVDQAVSCILVIINAFLCDPQKGKQGGPSPLHPL